jgi:hypothetical protein
VNSEGKRLVEPGTVGIELGGGQPGHGANVLTGKLRITGASYSVR